MLEMKFDAEAERQQLREERIGGETVFNGRILHVVNDQVRLPGGGCSSREVIRHVGAVCVLPVDEEGFAYVERQYRYPVDKVITEIPAGKLEDAGENRLAAARRELKEETGLTADEWLDMGDFYPAAAYSDEYITMYLARGLHKGEQQLDPDEFLEVKRVPLEELTEAVMKGEIPDAKSQTLILKAARYLGL